MNPVTPAMRQWLYVISAIASALVPLLVNYKIMDTHSGSAWANLIAVLAMISSGGAATAAVVVNKQRREGTLEFTGTPAEQAVAAIRTTIERAATAATDLDVVRDAISSVLNATVDAGKPNPPPNQKSQIDAGTMGH